MDFTELNLEFGDKSYFREEIDSKLMICVFMCVWGGGGFTTFESQTLVQLFAMQFKSTKRLSTLNPLPQVSYNYTTQINFWQNFIRLFYFSSLMNVSTTELSPSEDSKLILTK